MVRNIEYLHPRPLEGRKNVGAHNTTIRIDGDDFVFNYVGSYPEGEGGLCIGHIFTSVEKLSPVGSSLLEYAANQISGIDSVYGPVGLGEKELRVQFASKISSDETRKKLCNRLVEVFGEVCLTHQSALGASPITDTRRVDQKFLTVMTRDSFGLSTDALTASESREGTSQPNTPVGE